MHALANTICHESSNLAECQPQHDVMPGWLHWVQVRRRQKLFDLHEQSSLCAGEAQNPVVVVDAAGEGGGAAAEGGLALLHNGLHSFCLCLTQSQPLALAFLQGNNMG